MVSNKEMLKMALLVSFDLEYAISRVQLNQLGLK